LDANFESQKGVGSLFGQCGSDKSEKTPDPWYVGFVLKKPIPKRGGCHAFAAGHASVTVMLGSRESMSDPNAEEPSLWLLGMLSSLGALRVPGPEPELESMALMAPSIG
jgi:hypothetical protein